ncbi:YybH family protein [Foetidibacter luteolus]|uniref:YybH family protein n=1 Tax=Foetidibacter luteolus TaxID=2608880 RepID=UPI00129B7DB3|nr:DUF4440 domain-containing protein [Foetidibacter luteolus]
MKKIVLLFALLTSFQFCFSQTDEQEVRALLAKQVSDWNNGDIDAFMETYWKSDSLRFVSTKGATYGWQNTLERYKRTYPDTTVMGKLKFDLQSVEQLSAEYFFVLGKWHLTRSIGNVGGFYTLLIRKVKGKWVIVCDHTS